MEFCVYSKIQGAIVASCIKSRIFVCEKMGFYG